jgi:hypothetical protein
MSETANQKPRPPSRSKGILIGIRSRVIGDSRLGDGRGESRYVLCIYLQKWRENGSMVGGGESREKNKE